MITIEVPRSLLLSANGRQHRQQVAKITKQLREIGYWQARAAKQEPLEYTHLSVTVSWPPLKRKRDRLNLAPTMKACVDGFIDAGVLPDDNDERILSEYLHTDSAKCDPGLAAVLSFDFLPVQVTFA